MIAAIERVMARKADAAPRSRLAAEQHDLLSDVRQALLEIMAKEMPK